MTTPEQKARKAKVVADNKIALDNVRDYAKNQIAIATNNLKQVKARESANIKAQIDRNKANLASIK